MPAAIRERVPSRSSGAILAIVGLASLGCLAGAAFSHFEGAMRGALAVVGVALFAINAVVKKRLGYDVEVDATGIRELRPRGVTIAWAERPTCTLTTVAGPRMRSGRGAIVSAMTEAANIQTLAVAAGDRRIAINSVRGSRLADAVRAHAEVTMVAK